jgi:hypothetical protein
MTDLIFPELINKLSPGVREIQLRLSQDPGNTQLWRDLYDKASGEILMRVMTRIPHDQAVAFENAQIEPEETELLAFLGTQGNQPTTVCPTHGSSWVSQTQGGAMMCGLCGWHN